MQKIVLLIITIFFTILLSSCQGNREEQLKKLDELWGYCDNPHREFGELEYDTCKRKERSQLPSNKGKEIEPFNLTDFIDKMNGVGSNTVIAQTTINPFLWQGSIDVTSTYDLKIADATGGYIQTEWIYDKTELKKRCMIKIQITSAEYISTGVKSNFICENKSQDIWITDGNEYVDEEKVLTLKILEESQKYSSLLIN